MIRKPTDWINTWLCLGLAMLLIQILLGGITRLTGSGLSITRWDIITGVWYPMNEVAWNHEFELYKATPQFQKINSSFNLSDFQFIYFWEYAHRLWARLMGIIFFLPFCWFLLKKQLSKALIRQLCVLILLTGLVASLGWIMVSSGLINRPWVNAYKLAFHLITAVLTTAYLLWIIVNRKKRESVLIVDDRLRSYFGVINFFLLIQIFLGGVVAGMKAAIVAPTWPLLQGKWIPSGIFNWSSYTEFVFGEYEITSIGPVVMQFWHRSVAYLIFLLLVFAIYKLYKKCGEESRKVSMGIGVLLCLQVFLGVLTVINSVGSIPLWPAVLHQLFGIILFLYCLNIYWSMVGKANNV